MIQPALPNCIEADAYLELCRQLRLSPVWRGWNLRLGDVDDPRFALDWTPELCPGIRLMPLAGDQEIRYAEAFEGLLEISVEIGLTEPKLVNHLRAYDAVRRAFYPDDSGARQSLRDARSAVKIRTPLRFGRLTFVGGESRPPGVTLAVGSIAATIFNPMHT